MNSRRTFIGLCALLFVLSTAVTVLWSMSMPAMDGMSMAWMRMPGQGWLSVTATFVGMWMVMMVAMMLPSMAPILWRYRRTVGGAGAASPGRLTMVAGAAYLLVWIVIGMAVFPLGVALAAIQMRLPTVMAAVPIATGTVMVIAGAVQFTAWKARHLACCRAESGGGHALTADVATAWRQGLYLGIHCLCCCANLTAVLLVVGVMDLRAMAAVALAITLERLAPGGDRTARILGIILIGTGLLAIVRAAAAHA